MSELNLLPKIGEYYSLWDTHLSPEYQYICRVERIIPAEKARKMKVKFRYYDEYDEEMVTIRTSLYEILDCQREEFDWQYPTRPEYFLEITCPTFDDNKLYAVKVYTGTWKVINVKDNFEYEGAVVDVDNKWFKTLWNRLEVRHLLKEPNKENYLKK